MDLKTARLVDANLNRAREGLRVLEDTARFIWNDGAAYKRLRRLRHQLHDLTELKFKDLLAARESRTDSGRVMKESSRSSLESVVFANMRRAQEAVRVLEEYGKVFTRSASGGFKRIRYQLYIEEKRLLKKL